MDPIMEITREMEEVYREAQANVEDGDKFEELMSRFNELKARKQRLELLDEHSKELASNQRVQAAEAGTVAPGAPESGYDKAVKQLAAAARQAYKVVEGTDEDGGYIVPEDIRTKIEHFREAKFHLGQLVTNVSVKTDKGKRTYRKRTTQSGFGSVDEGGKIPMRPTPQFGRMSYEIEKYGGIYTMTNEVLADTDQNLVAELVTWIAEDSRITRNALILTTLNEKYTRDTNPETPKTITSFDDLKHIINVDLGQAFKETSVVVTNDSGWDWLDCLKDKNDRYLLREDTNDPLKKYIVAGATRIRVVCIPNEDLNNEAADGGYNIPFFIGDLKEGVVFWDRKKMSLKASDVAVAGTGDGAVNAFDEDLTLTRAIEREDCTTRDERAFFKAYLFVEDDEGGSGGSGEQNAG